MRASLGFLLLLGVPAGPAQPVTAEPRVGLASVVERRAEALRKPVVRTLVIRDDLYRNDRLRTGADAGTKLHVRLLDQTVLTLGPSSEIVLDDFAVNPKAGTAEVSLKLSRGLLRFVGGQHAGTGTRYRVRTPVATIGVRGTAFDVKVDDQGQTTVQLTEGELSFENEDGIEVILDEPLETSRIEDEDAAPSEPEVDDALSAEFDELDLSEEELAEDRELAEELDDADIGVIEDEESDDDDAPFEDDEFLDDEPGLGDMDSRATTVPDSTEGDEAADGDERPGDSDETDSDSDDADGNDRDDDEGDASGDAATPSADDDADDADDDDADDPASGASGASEASGSDDDDDDDDDDNETADDEETDDDLRAR